MSYCELCWWEICSSGSTHAFMAIAIWKSRFLNFGKSLPASFAPNEPNLIFISLPSELEPLHLLEPQLIFHHSTGRLDARGKIQRASVHLIKIHSVTLCVIEKIISNTFGTKNKVWLGLKIIHTELWAIEKES